MANGRTIRFRAVGTTLQDVETNAQNIARAALKGYYGEATWRRVGPEMRVSFGPMEEDESIETTGPHRTNSELTVVEKRVTKWACDCVAYVKGMTD